MTENWCKTISEARKWAMTLIAIPIKYWELPMLHIEYIFDDFIVKVDGKGTNKKYTERKTRRKILWNSYFYRIDRRQSRDLTVLLLSPSLYCFFLQFSTYLNSYRLTSWRQSVRLYSIQFCSRTFSISILPNFTTTTKFALETLQFQQKFHDGKAANTYSISLMASKRKKNIGNSRRNSFKSMDVCHRWQKKIVGIVMHECEVCLWECTFITFCSSFFALYLFLFRRERKIEFHSCMYREDFHFASGKITFDDVWYCEQVQKKNERRASEGKSDSNGSSDLFDGYLIKWTCCLSAFLFVDLFQSHSLTDYPNHQRNN